MPLYVFISSRNGATPPEDWLYVTIIPPAPHSKAFWKISPALHMDALIEPYDNPKLLLASFFYLSISHEPSAPLVVWCWSYCIHNTFPPEGGLTNRRLVTGCRLKAALRCLLLYPSIQSLSYCSLMRFFIVSFLPLLAHSISAGLIHTYGHELALSLPL